ncbi:VanZ family protein [Streptomyces sp. NPDC048277]|uniref:VanZ family protein n=1 Tax=Streptomyces sp. NPDC048277 TaxID=3155027 RepID=UPI0033DAECF8
MASATSRPRTTKGDTNEGTKKDEGTGRKAGMFARAARVFKAGRAEPAAATAAKGAAGRPGAAAKAGGSGGKNTTAKKSTAGKKSTATKPSGTAKGTTAKPGRTAKGTSDKASGTARTGRFGKGAGAKAGDSGKAGGSGNAGGSGKAAGSAKPGAEPRALPLPLRLLAMACAFVAMVAFAAVLARLTLDPSPASVSIAHTNLHPGSTIKLYLDQPSVRDTVKQIGGNVLLGLPFGILVPVLAPGARGVLRVLALTAIVMLLVEMAQGALVPGRAFDVDDVILNTSGALIGWLLLGRRLGRAVHARKPKA